MAIHQLRPRRKVTGSRYITARGKKLREMGNEPTLPSIAEDKFKHVRTMGGNDKVRRMSALKINAIDPKTRKAVVATMKNVVENPANRHYVRMNALTKGAIVDTDKGKVRITSRPAQDGCVNGVIVL
ncbi:30S ribosomal protein S8e [Candidatus Woesearchaeota archaeon CG10_big_fil_rev_8_21_14_0_10_34_8]|nr:MAG: 30S ribosomal protein S8e [Candidatus Woesearchaeota archaeon CG10_big_fil_rev_8_21_14_0_10_34_8]